MLNYISTCDGCGRRFTIGDALCDMVFMLADKSQRAGCSLCETYSRKIGLVEAITAQEVSTALSRAAGRREWR